MPNPNPGSNRVSFQWRYVERYLRSLPKDQDGNIFPSILNIGCADDPIELGDIAWHLDIDDWSYMYKRFTQADAHDLSVFPDRSFDLVIMGDIIEHLYDPLRAIKEAARVSNRILIMTIFEEWTLPGYGQFIDIGAAHGDEASRELGYKDREDYQTTLFPLRKGVSDDKVPHLIHINQFSDAGVIVFVNALLIEDWALLEFAKAFEANYREHSWYNWLIAVSRGDLK